MFDIRDPYAPKELAYFVAPPGNLGGSPAPVERSNYAMSKPAFNVERGEIWYSDGVGLPSARRCASRRAFTIRLRAPQGARLRSATVKVDGKRVTVRRAGRRLTARVNPRRTDEGHHDGQRRRAHHLGSGRPRDADAPDLQKATVVGGVGLPRARGPAANDRFMRHKEASGIKWLV